MSRRMRGLPPLPCGADLDALVAQVDFLNNLQAGIRRIHILRLSGKSVIGNQKNDHCNGHNGQHNVRNFSEADAGSAIVD